MSLSFGRSTWGGRVAAGLLAVLLGTVAPAGAEPLVVEVRSPDGEPVKDAVAYAIPLDGDGRPLPPPEPTEIDQVDKEYVPYVTAVRVGTRVSFPNRDQIRHHVYSFSEAKTFEIPLYEGVPAEPVVFDKPGDVALGCNIHDWMKAYVFVVETPHFGVTGAEGAVRLEVPPGEYRVEAWHPELKGEPEATGHRVTVEPDTGGRAAVPIERKHVWKPRRSPSLGDPVYR